MNASISAAASIAASIVPEAVRTAARYVATSVGIAAPPSAARITYQSDGERSEAAVAFT